MPSRPSALARSAQRGATLIIMLVMLVLITLVTVSTVRTTTMDEKMAGNARDRNKALQAAEAAVSKCLDNIADGSYPIPKRLTPTTPPNPPVWDVEANWTNSSVTVLMPNAGLSSDPQCLAETLGGDNYRVTGRSAGGSADTVVILQATYTTD